MYPDWYSLSTVIHASPPRVYVLYTLHTCPLLTSVLTLPQYLLHVFICSHLSLSTYSSSPSCICNSMHAPHTHFHPCSFISIYIFILSIMHMQQHAPHSRCTRAPAILHFFMYAFRYLCLYGHGRMLVQHALFKMQTCVLWCNIHCSKMHTHVLYIRMHNLYTYIYVCITYEHGADVCIFAGTAFLYSSGG